MPKLQIFVGDKRARDNKAGELIIGGGCPVVPVSSGSPRVTHAGDLQISDFSPKSLKKIFSKYRSIIIKDAHGFSINSLDSLICFGAENHVDIYLLCAAADSNNMPYKAVCYLSDMGYEIQQLDAFKAPEAALKPASELLENKKPKKQKDVPVFELVARISTHIEKAIQTMDRPLTDYQAITGGDAIKALREIIRAKEELGVLKKKIVTDEKTNRK
ncbi:MAG: hypothetical protein FWG39_01145 [Alphaproteobacteria bacterium]|nr:hypothetical protein [Alphaproteobacteria bacterium]